ncbi:amino acid racemase [Candidatus Woesearchaeota archaeon]|nr:amino acid racemase [Candidatus Woesearchaeota archaeon]
MQKYETIGILGGMGPEASAELYFNIVKLFQKKYGAVYDRDFPEIIIVNLPIPDVVETAKDRAKVKTMLIAAVKKLEMAGANFVAIPCNSVMKYLPEMQKAISIPIINLVKETANIVENCGLKKVGLLATELTIKSRTYEKALGSVKLLTLSNSRQEETTKIIMNILAGKKLPSDRQMLIQFTKQLERAGAEKVILGCTELPLLVKGGNLINTLQVLAKASVERSVRATNKNYLSQIRGGQDNDKA